jgi:UDP-glucose 4-epimerase
MRVLVTGGAGFIGSHVVGILGQEGHEVVIVDDLSSGDRRNVPPATPWHQVSLQDPELEAVFADQRIDAVCNLAAKTGMRESLTDPLTDIQTNIIGFVNLLEFAVKYKVGKFVQSSTGGALYGDTDDLPAREDTPTWPISPYGVSKLAGEKYLYYYHAVHGLPVVILRYSNVFGPRNERKAHVGSITTFIRRVLDGDEIRINGDGKQTRDFIYVGDIARANALAVRRTNEDYLVCNTSGGRETSVLEIIGCIETHTGKKARVTHAPEIRGEVRRAVLSNTKAGRELGWRPLVSIDDGVRLTVEHLVENRE